MSAVLGINLSHDTSACLIKDGRVYAAEEERWSEIKHNTSTFDDDYLFPENSIRFVLEESGTDIKDLDHVVCVSMSGEDIPNEIIQTRSELKCFRKVEYISHHKAHILSAYLLSPFQEAVGLCVDGAGSMLGNDVCSRERVSGYYLNEDTCVRLYQKYDRLSVQHGKIQKSKNSIGIFYENMAKRCIPVGDEPQGSMMALAAFAVSPEKYYNEIRRFVTLYPTGEYQFHEDIAQKNKTPYTIGAYQWIPGQVENIPFQERADFAAAVQRVYEEVLTHVLNELYERTHVDNLVLSGGCGLNSKFNGIIQEKTHFKNVYVPPAPSDSGVSVGAALYGWNILLKKDRLPTPLTADFGPTVEELSDEECDELRRLGVQVFCEEENKLCVKVADLIMNKKIVIWCRGAMEFGPRALGNRSFIAHPGDAMLRDRMNNLKKRALFRPLAPAVLEECFDAFFSGDADYYMNKVAYVRSSEQLAGVAHVDGSARVQLVTPSCPFYPLLKVMNEKYGIPVIINTSLNKKGKPIIRSKTQAIDAFFCLEVDAAVIGNTLLVK